MALETVKKHLNFLFLNIGTTDTPEWARARTSVDLAHTMNAETEDFDYIADESKTTELISYAPSIGQTQTAYIGDKVYDYIFNKYYTAATGSDAVTQCMMVYQQPGATADSHQAKMFDALITIDTYDLVAKTITYTINQRGTPTLGEATIGTDDIPTFTPTVTP